MSAAPIRAERAEDYAAIAAVVAAAFGPSAPLVPQLVANIRASDNFVAEWSLVAEQDGVVVGHVLVSYVSLVDGGAEHRVPSLSPLAVAPDHQRRGIGSALVRRVLEVVDAAGEPLVVLEGNPAYYGRFGFEHSAPHGIRIDLPHWAQPEAAQVARLRAYDAHIRGRVVYPPAFAAVVAAADRAER